MRNIRGGGHIRQNRVFHCAVNISLPFIEPQATIIVGAVRYRDAHATSLMDIFGSFIGYRAFNLAIMGIFG
jgi:hypothetical protein